MSVPFHHGARVFQSGSDAVLTPLVNTSIGGILGTAPDASESDFPTDRPFTITTPSQVKALGSAGTLKESLETWFDIGMRQINIVRIDEGADAAALLANAVGSSTALTGISAFLKASSLGLPVSKLITAPGIGTTSVADGVSAVAVTAGGSGYSEATVLTVTGNGTGAVLKPIISAGVITGVIVVKPGYGYTEEPTVAAVDAGGGKDATFAATVGVVKNPVIADAIGVTDKTRAMFYADGPDGTDQQAVQARQVIGSKRVFYSDPRVLKSIDGVSVPMPSSTVHAAMQARADHENGVHWTGTNKVIPGIIGTNRAIVHGTQSNYLNENRVNTIVNMGDGFRTWGVWTCSDDPVWQFVNVVRTTDAVNESIERAFRQFVGRPMTRANLDFAVMAGRAALDRFEKAQMLLPGSLFKLGAGNVPETGAQGIVMFTMAFEVRRR